jgi:hypothetical protein
MKEWIAGSNFSVGRCLADPLSVLLAYYYKENANKGTKEMFYEGENTLR